MQIGTRVRHKEHGERGVIEDFRHDGHPRLFAGNTAICYNVQ